MAVHPATLPETQTTSLPGPLDRYLGAAARSLRRRHALDIAAHIRPGELGCVDCGHVGPQAEFRRGRGRARGEHPEHRYCPVCGKSIDWFGYVSGDLVANFETECGA